MQLKSKLYSAVGMLCFLMGTSTVFAGGMSVIGIGTRSETLQAFTGVADDPSAIYYNPAGITQIPGLAIQNDIAYIESHHTYTSSLPGAGIFGATTQSDKAAWGPDLFITKQVNSQFFMGFGLEAPFARLTKFKINGATYFNPLESEILRLDALPTLAVKINQYIAVGASLVLSYVRNRIDMLGLHEYGTGEGLTGQIGALFSLPHHVRIGLNYRGPEDLSIDGRGRFIPALPIVVEDRYQSTFKFPGVFNAGISWQMTPELLGSFEYDYEMWRRIKAIVRYYNNPMFALFQVVNLNPRNSSNYRFGLEYRPQAHHDHAFRLGYAWIGTALPANNILPAIADYEANTYDVGYSRYFKHFRLDAGYEYLDGKSRQSQGLLFPGQFKLHIHTFMLGAIFYLA